MVEEGAENTITKPPFSYITLIVSAMSSKPSKHITLNEIYAWIMSTFAYYRKNTRRWQNSVRHALSFNDCFIKIPRPSGEAGKGCYWTVHPRAVDMFENGSSMRRNRKFVDESRVRTGPGRRRIPAYSKANIVADGNYCMKQECRPILKNQAKLPTSTLVNNLKHSNPSRNVDDISGAGNHTNFDPLWYSSIHKSTDLDNFGLGCWNRNQWLEFHSDNNLEYQRETMWRVHNHPERQSAQHQYPQVSSSVIITTSPIPVGTEFDASHDSIRNPNPSDHSDTKLWPFENRSDQRVVPSICTTIRQFVELDSQTSSSV
ncbi:unnamed protein product [Echinostoma caproni]|uniref:Fork-head domain-containing protein n=1 Tax=Echinostoma caproni TaxID=27848 RepID=A0A183AQU9_9TREM|nr:unnamed protein product [Echinostoma caproni]